MDENKSAIELNEALKGIWDSLTDEQKEKAKACRSMDELAALAGQMGVELPDELLDSVAGGSIYIVGTNTEVLNDETYLVEGVGRTKNLEEIKKWAQARGISTNEMSMNAYWNWHHEAAQRGITFDDSPRVWIGKKGC